LDSKAKRINAFMPCTEVTHAHGHAVQFLICRQCSTVAEIEDPAVSEALESAAHGKGFRAGHAVVEVEGTCAACYHPG
jgi:Fur family zinc uptake transcriptional regulator